MHFAERLASGQLVTEEAEKQLGYGGSEDGNCTLPSIVEFPNLMRKKSILYSSICFTISLYFFIMLAVVCDDYLMPAMERLCYTLRMPYDIAGATFLSAATSCPELFISLTATFVTHGDIGIGAIVGSSVFNMLGIAALCGLFSNVKHKLDWWPLTRDCVWYLIAIFTLFATLFDSRVYLYEAIVTVILYFIYLLLLSYDRKIQSLCRNVDLNKDILGEDPMERKDDPLKTFKESVCTMPQKDDKWFQKMWFGIKYPAVLILALTIPSARSIFYLTLLHSMMWIGIITYCVVWTLTIIGYNCNIPDSIMGLTALAVGTSVPEVVSSLIIVKKGYASMAMCNAIGSNTFDIFICLGAPWLISVVVSGKYLAINSTGLAVTTGMLILTEVITFATFFMTNFVLGKTVGWIALVSYAIFLAVAILLECLNLKDMCDIESGKYAHYTQ